MHLRALYLSVVLCSAAAAAACCFSSPASIAGFAGPVARLAGPVARFAGPVAGHAGRDAARAAAPEPGRWTLYRTGARRRLAPLLPHAAAGGFAGALLLAAGAAYGTPRPRRTRRVPALGMHPASPQGPERTAGPMHPVEREAFARLGECRALPADPGVPGGCTLYEQSRRDWLAAANAFGAGTLESQLALLRHMGKLLACRSDPSRPGGYRLAADPAPLATQALRQLRSFQSLPIPARRELMQALYTLQSGWTAADLPPRIALALRRLDAAVAPGGAG